MSKERCRKQVIRNLCHDLTVKCFEDEYRGLSPVDLAEVFTTLANESFYSYRKLSKYRKFKDKDK